MSLETAALIDRRDRTGLEGCSATACGCRSATLLSGRSPMVVSASSPSGPRARVRRTSMSSSRPRALRRPRRRPRAPPRQHQVRYFGVVSNHHALRQQLRLAPTGAARPALAPLFEQACLSPRGRVAELDIAAKEAPGGEPKRAR